KVRPCRPPGRGSTYRNAATASRARSCRPRRCSRRTSARPTTTSTPRWRATSAAARPMCAFGRRSRMPRRASHKDHPMNSNRFTPHTASMSRRVFLKASAAAGAGLSLGIFTADAAAQMSGPGKTVGSAATGAFEPNAFLRIGKDNSVTVVVKHVEMGQGTYTGLPTLVAEELDAAWSQVKVVGAPADAKVYNNLFWGEAQGTGGSTALANSFEQYRQAGAAARAMLVGAAAQQWKVPADSVQVKNGVVSHASGKKATFGELAD